MPTRFSCGFDLRVSANSHEKDAAQWNQFLLTTSKRSLISADTLVWPEPEGVNSLIQDNAQVFWNPLGLASDLEQLISSCRMRGFPIANCVPVCLTISESVLIAMNGRFGPSYFHDLPQEEFLLGQGWRFLGFDLVALMGLHSGLNGIGYKEPYWSQLRAQFGAALNEVGLFSDEATAAEFAKVRGVEIPSHAPFDVVGILVHDPISQ